MSELSANEPIGKILAGRVQAAPNASFDKSGSSEIGDTIGQFFDLRDTKGPFFAELGDGDTRRGIVLVSPALLYESRWPNAIDRALFVFIDPVLGYTSLVVDRPGVRTYDSRYPTDHPKWNTNMYTPTLIETSLRETLQIAAIHRTTVPGSIELHPTRGKTIILGDTRYTPEYRITAVSQRSEHLGYRTPHVVPVSQEVVMAALEASLSFANQYNSGILSQVENQTSAAVLRRLHG